MAPGSIPRSSKKGKEDHFGLRGMKERAERIDARLRIVSSSKTRTAITLVVPGRVAFRSTPGMRVLEHL
jgi:nitrate/nitrite-specific signal transduction histidine kinase